MSILVSLFIHVYTLENNFFLHVLGLEMLTLFAFEKENRLFDSTDQIYLCFYFLN